MKITAVLLFALLLSACASATRVDVSWTDPDHRGTIDDVLVVGISREEAIRHLYEQQFAQALRQHGVKASPSREPLPANKNAAISKLEKTLAGGEYRYILITHLISVDKTQIHHPARTTLAPGFAAGGMYGYYGRSYQYVYQPAYSSEQVDVKLETSLYDAGNEKLLWSAKSVTMDPTSDNETIESVIAALIENLNKSGLLPKNKK